MWRGKGAGTSPENALAIMASLEGGRLASQTRRLVCVRQSLALPGLLDSNIDTGLDRQLHAGFEIDHHLDRFGVDSFFGIIAQAFLAAGLLTPTGNGAAKARV